jgi:uncharacterized protein YggT (Ycf19 family)
MFVGQILEVIKYLLIFIGVMTTLFVVLVVAISFMPDNNPLKRLLTALSYRVMATLGAAVVAIPIEPIPVVDVAYDVLVPLVLIYYWYTFFRDAYLGERKKT